MNRKTAAILTCICMALFFAGCGSAQKSFTYSEPRKVIFDTDTAADDAMAIILAAKAQNIELLGVTVLAGNVSLEQGCRNALMSLEIAGKSDVPVYPGSVTRLSGEQIEPYSVFGEDGMGDHDLIHPAGKPQTGDGIDFILETVRSQPGEIEILATGPLTNIAKAIQKDPETMRKVKRIWSMGSGGTANLGNATPVAEFNVYTDAAAYEVVLESGIPMTVVGLDVCTIKGVRISEKELAKLAEAGGCGLFISRALTGLLETCAGSDGYTEVCDPVTAAALIWGDFVTESETCDAEAVIHDCPAVGQVIFYPQSKAYDMVGKEFDYHVDVVTDLNAEDYLDNVCRLIR